PARYRELAKQRDRLMERSRAEEKAALAKIRAAHPLPGWPDWLQARAGRGDTEALAVLRSRADRSQRLTASLLRAETAGEAAAIVLTARRPVVGRDGAVAYRLPDGGLVRDEAAKVVVAQESRAAAVLALTLAARRFGERPLVVEGSPAFRGWVAEAARLPGTRARFADPAFEQVRMATHESPVRNTATAKKAPAPDPARRPMSASGAPSADGPPAPAATAPPYHPWSAALKGEFTYCGLRDEPGGPSLVWRQGDQLFAQAATPNAQLEARDVEPGDAVIFFQGRPVIARRQETDHDSGRDTGFGR
ncbi:MAG TPA: LPD7 domain-containing protein, partial [Patescibacteria group bacterium]|nr:LPD7 domain-containing protein [Patescibacteria group bacterium]